MKKKIQTIEIAYLQEVDENKVKTTKDIWGGVKTFLNMFWLLQSC